jgi:dihydroorotate dehydrogenase electron transfer subunit
MVRTMVQTQARVTDVEKSSPFARVTFSAPQIAPTLAPGRFVLADLDNYLRTPLFPAWLGTGGFDVLVSPEHPAVALRPGDDIDLIGPLGRGFEVPTTARRLLLIAGTTHLPVLLPLARQGNQDFSQNPDVSVALLLSASTAAELYPVRLLPPALEVHIVTADGSAGHGGSVLGLFPNLVRWADCVCIAPLHPDDPATYSALAAIVREVRVRPAERFAQALVVPPMACGVGACQGCAVPVVRGTQLACTDGPVFDLLELQ